MYSNKSNKRDYVEHINMRSVTRKNNRNFTKNHVMTTYTARRDILKVSFILKYLKHRHLKFIQLHFDALKSQTQFYTLSPLHKHHPLHAYCITYVPNIQDKHTISMDIHKFVAFGSNPRCEPHLSRRRMLRCIYHN